mmetsp:Transcript_48906/g.43847  ORF Transcript_48906/g.43847 Transcript_48906/m.43847 type:complete len:204 (+) Transcript_48906:48-659(+)|eukprot:CAMPEP_0201569044 /NCGR_PEP_ID=MMETSP0190_2-20130828/10496_1 /ASSEMBLY_ACC=CAM_ASM_000263 /TAXON_ID=37353 /ORGANISM="Rosalina sp." /LENGTH=203 /DNA_ID=CAMNT_0047990921 /DNA_START=20 /DNA_END=631 /DNA_ORIENTATION=+
MAKNVSGTAVYGQQGAQMLVSLRRAAWLPQYDADGNNKVVQETKELYEKMHNTLLAAKDVDTNKPEAYAISCSVIVHHHAIMRNKRILCAYHRYRSDVLEDHRWEKGPILTEFARNKINPHEELYFENYNKLLNEYIRDIDVDITSNLTPPKELKQEIAVIENVGDVQTSNGPMNLLRNTRLLANVNDVETLIRNGQVVKTKD